VKRVAAGLPNSSKVFQYLAQHLALKAIDVMAKFQYGPLNRKIFDNIIGFSMDGAVDFSALS